MPTVRVLEIAFVPMLSAPVPAFKTTLVAPVELPIVIVLALAFTPIFIAPVVPLSKVKALVVADSIVGTVKVPVIVSPVIRTKPVAVSSAVFSSANVIFLVCAADVSTIGRTSSSATVAPVSAVSCDIFWSAIFFAPSYSGVYGQTTDFGKVL